MGPDIVSASFLYGKSIADIRYLLCELTRSYDSLEGDYFQVAS